MLHLISVLDGQAYAIEAARIAEVLPLVRLQPASGPGQPASFRIRGRLAPAIDLSQLLLGRPFEARLSTRILVISCEGGQEVVGLVAENALETLSVAQDAWEAQRRPGEPRHLGPTAMHGARPLRRLEINPLLDAAFGRLTTIA